MICRTSVVVWGVCALFLCACAQKRYLRPTADKYYEDAQKALSKKDCWEAQKFFRNLLSDFPGSHLVDDAQYGLGMAGFCSEDFVTSAFEFERLLNEYPTSPWVDEARYQIGMCYYTSSQSVHHDQEDTYKAIREFRRFVEDYPNSDLVPETQERIEELNRKLGEKKLMVAQNYYRWRNYVSASRYCDIILAEYSDPDLIRQAWFVMAQCKVRTGEQDEAMSILTRLAAEDGASGKLKKEIIKATTALQEEMARKPEITDPSPVPEDLQAADSE